MPIHAAKQDPPGLIELRAVSIRQSKAPRSWVLRRFDWRLQPQTSWVITGPPGAGKSSLASVMAGISKPAEGTVNFFGKRITGINGAHWLEERRRIGFVFEDGGRPFHRLTVYENLALPLHYHQPALSIPYGEWIALLLKKTLLEPYAQWPAIALNRAWSQRLGLARALTLQPRVLILDSPLSGLDPAQQGWWIALTRELAAGAASWYPAPVSLVITALDPAPWADSSFRDGRLKEHQWTEAAGRDELRCQATGDSGS